MREQQVARHPPLVRCPTCGNYAARDSLSSGRYCSAACEAKFLRCTTCGAYYEATKGYSPEHCSRECRARYTMQRSYGPAQITIRMEDLV